MVKQWVMCLFILSLLGIGGCQSERNMAAQTPESYTPQKDNIQSKQEINTNDGGSKPSAPETTSVSSSDWIGEWKLEGSNEKAGSFITIVSTEQKSLLFELSAFHTTNAEGTNANTGNIPHGSANMNGNEATYHDGDFSMTMILTDGKLNVRTNDKGLGYFGHGVIVDGTYVKQQGSKSAGNSDYLIVPGESVGKIHIGMTVDDIRQILGEPTTSDKGIMTYKSKANYLKIYLKDNVVEEIEFTSPSFMTDEGINTSNYDKTPDRFTVYEYHSNFLQLRYEWKKAGLLFITMNADAPHGNTQYSVSRHGYIYQGSKPPLEPFSDAAWKQSSMKK